MANDAINYLPQKNKRLMRLTAFSFAILLITLSVLFLYLQATMASPRTLPKLKSGDLIFQTSSSSQTMGILLASRSVYSHMGIIKILPNDDIAVIEAIGPVRETPLDQWIKRGIAERVAVKRLMEITPAQINDVLTAAKTYYGRAYDFFFYSGNKEIYCSELVYDAFAAAGIKLGKMQSLDTLNIDNYFSRKLLEERLKNHPLCKDLQPEKQSTCKNKVMKQTLVTPQSIFEDKNLTLIYTNY